MGRQGSAVETDLAREGLDSVGNPDVVGAAVHPRPVRMRALPIGERGEDRRSSLGRAEAGRHQPGRRRIKAGVEVAAHDRRRTVRPAVDPCQKLLNLKEVQGIVATRHVEVGAVEIDGPLLDHDAGNQCDDVAGLIIEIAGFDARESRH